MQEHEKPTPQDLLALRGELRARWEQLPPEHQATMVLTLISDVMEGEWGDWLREAIALTYPVTDTAPEREKQNAPTVGSIKERYTAFGFTYTENLYDWVGHERFLDLIQAEKTTVHQVEVSSNN